jgi:VWFA-related protein
MPSHPRRLLALSALVAAALGSAAGAWAQTAVDRTIFLSVLDEAGNPVRDIKLGEILIREDGVDREVISVDRATEPLCVALLVDTTPSAGPYIRDIRNSLVAFARQVRAAGPDARISVTEFGQAAVPIVPFTTDAERLEKDINRIYPKPDASSVLLEALVDASNSLAKQNSPRRAIVVFNMEGTLERSREEPGKIQEAIRKAGAQLWVVSLQKGRNTLETRSQRDFVLNTLTKNTGGGREFIVSESAIEQYMKAYAVTLTSQYAVTYKRPSSDRPKVVQTGVARRALLKLHASGFAPQ